MNAETRFKRKKRDRLHRRMLEATDSRESVRLAVILYRKYFQSPRQDGGPGSGNHNHESVPGVKGGSAPQGVATSPASFGGYSSKNFADAVSSAKSELQKVSPETAWRVTAHTQEELDSEFAGAKMHVTEGGSTVAVTTEGDIVSVCKKPGDKMHGSQLIALAVQNGGEKLDSYDGNHGFYLNCGFEPVSWCKWDEKYAPDGWKKGRDNPEDVVFYKYTGNAQHYSKEEASEHLKNFKANVKASDDYDIAKAARDKEI